MDTSARKGLKIVWSRVSFVHQNCENFALTISLLIDLRVTGMGKFFEMFNEDKLLC